MKIADHFLRFLFCFLFMTCVATEVFSYTFFGNRILTATNSLTNCTYFSNWYERPIKYQKHITIFMERLKRDSVLMAGKLFRMDLVLFTTVRIFEQIINQKCYNFKFNIFMVTLLCTLKVI